MTKRLHHSSSSSSEDLSDLNDFNEYFISNHLSCRTHHSGRYQSDIYTGLISSNRSYSNRKLLTRLEQLLTLYHDDKIRIIFLTIYHYTMKHQWSNLLIYLKTILQSSYCRAYIRIFWQLIFRCLLELKNSVLINRNFLPQTFDDLFHSPTIDRTQAFYSYLCLHLITNDKYEIEIYYDLESRYKNFNQPYSSGRCKYVNYLPKFDRQFEQLILIQLKFLIDYQQWSINKHLISINPFLIHSKIDNEQHEIELWTFKFQTNFNEIQLISNTYFDIYDTYLLKYISFLHLTQTNIEQIDILLDDYVKKHKNYINAYKYIYWYNSNLENLKYLIELDPSSSPYVMIYCRELSNLIECFDRLFDYFDYEKNRNDIYGWKFFYENFLNINYDDNNHKKCIENNWIIRKNIWEKFHFQSIQRMNIYQALIAYILLDNDNQKRMKIREKWLENIENDQLEELHRFLTS